MTFTFQLSASRNRPIAPSVRIEEDGQIRIELRQYTPTKGSSIDFFNSMLYEGIQAQYGRLGLSETNPGENKEQSGIALLSYNMGLLMCDIHEIKDHVEVSLLIKSGNEMIKVKGKKLNLEELKKRSELFKDIFDIPKTFDKA